MSAVWLILLGGSGLVAWAAGAVLGYILGRRSEVQRRVDAVLRRETRPRHPSGAAERPYEGRCR